MSKRVPIERAYSLLQDYLTSIHHKSAFPIINAKTNFETIGTYIDDLQKSQWSSSTNLNDQLAHIVYLSNLSYFYVNNSGMSYRKIVSNLSKSKNRLMEIKELLEEKSSSFIRNLKQMLQSENTEKDTFLPILTEHYLAYLDTVKNADISKLAKLIANLVDGIDLQAIKTDTEKNYTEINTLFEKYNAVNSQTACSDRIRFDSTANQIFSDDKEEEIYHDAEDMLDSNTEENKQPAARQGESIENLSVTQNNLSIDDEMEFFDAEEISDEDKISVNFFLQLLIFIKNWIKNHFYKPEKKSQPEINQLLANTAISTQEQEISKISASNNSRMPTKAVAISNHRCAFHKLLPTIHTNQNRLLCSNRFSI